MANELDLRQSEYRGTLDQIGNQVTPKGNHLLNAINNQMTPLLRMSAASSPSLVVSVGGGDLTDSETNRRRAIPHVGTAYVQFTSGTITFPASSGGNITCSPGTTLVLTVGSGNYCAVLVYLDGTGNLNVLPATDSAVLNTAITNLPPSPDSTLPLGFIVVQNVAGVIQNITQGNIAQFGTGAGGGGTGNVTVIETALRDYNNFAGTKYLDPNIFRQTKTTKVDGSSTGVFDLVKSAYKLTTIGQTFVSSNLANAEFLAEGVDIPDVHLYVHWLLGFIDNAATYEVSRDGGTNWQAVTMSRVGTTSVAFRGYKVFTDEVTNQTLQNQTTPTTSRELTASGADGALAVTFTPTTTEVIRQFTIDVNKTESSLGSVVGNFKLQIVKDSSNLPSTASADLVAESNLVNLPASVSTGNSTVTVTMPNTVLAGGQKYWLVISTDAQYKSAFVTATNRLAIRVKSSPTLTDATENVTTGVWTATATEGWTFAGKGRVHDLRIRITSGTSLVYLEGMGLYFPSDDGMTRPAGTKYVQRFYFSGDANQTDFALNWVPDPDLLDILDPYRGQVYAIEPGVAKITGQTVSFAPNTFQFPGESIVLIFRQVKGVGIDNSDSNAAKISTHTQNLLDVGGQASDLEYVTIPSIAVANTQVTNRANIPDMTQDLGVRMGIGRTEIQDISLEQLESGPSSEPVFSLENDRYDRTRFVGNWSTSTTSSGTVANPALTTDFMEVTFYGTGFNLLTSNASAAFDMKYLVDGGSEASFYTATPSAVINARGYSQNTILPVVSGLTLGIHTIKIRPNTNPASIGVAGFEVLHETSTLTVNPGSQYVTGSKRTLATQQSPAYASAFETGTLAAKGGRVVVYQKSDATIGTAVTPTDATQNNLAAATHANEEVARVYSWREFGANRTDDFSTLTNSGFSARAFVLDSDTAALVSTNAAAELIATSTSTETLEVNNNGSDVIVVTFIGTGLDLLIATNSTNTTTGWTFSVDNTSIGTFTLGTTLKSQIVPVVSGLPYGTHTVKFTTNNTGSEHAGIINFTVYQPKKPTLPTGAKELADYNVMATFAANSTAGRDTISTGVMRKHNQREFIYQGTWAAALATTDIGGVQIQSTTTGDFWQYTFFGTGFDFRFSNNATAVTWQFTVDGSTNLTTLGGTPVTSSYGAGVSSFTNTTGTLVTTTTATVGNGVRLSGLTLGVHTVKFAKTAGTGTIFSQAMDLIVPVHSHKSNLYFDVQNTLSVGSQSLSDSRKITSLEQLTGQKAFAQAYGVASAPTTTSTVYVPCPDMSATIKTTTGRIRISYAISSLCGNTQNFGLYVDGVRITDNSAFGSGGNAIASATIDVAVAPGTHKVDLYWMIATGVTLTATLTQRWLTVEET